MTSAVPRPDADAVDADAVRVASARGAAWNYLTFALTRGTVLVSTILLAWLLRPVDFGLVAIGLLVVKYVDGLKDLGITAALVYRPTVSRAAWGTGFTLSLASSAVLGGLLFLSADGVSAFFDNPDAAAVVRVLAVAFFVSGLSTVPAARLQRALDFRRRTVPEVSGALVRAGLSIGLALAGFGAWSLVWGHLAGYVVTTVLYFAVTRYAPVPRWDTPSARTLLRYGLPLTWVAVVGAVLVDLDYLMIGHREGATELGYYTMAFRIPELAILGFLLVMSQVLFPALSRLRGDDGAMRSAYLGVQRYAVLLAAPMGLLMAFTADDLVRAVFSDQWAPSGPALSFLAMYAVVYSSSANAGDAYKATGRTGIIVWLSLFQLAVALPTLWIAAGYGFATVAAAMLGMHLVLSTVKLAVAGRVLGLGVRDYARSLRTPVLAAAAMAGALALTGLMVPDLGSWPRLVLDAVVGLAIYLLAVRLLDPGLFAANVARAAGLLHRRSERSA